MSEPGKRAVDKLNIIKNIAKENETKELAKIMIEYITDSEKGEAGFKHDK